MNDADYAAGFAALALILLPWPFVGYRLSRRLLPEWEGAASALVAAVIAVSGLLVVAELLGITDQFARWQMAAASVAVALVVMGAVKPVPRTAPVSSSRPPFRGTRAASLVLAAFCVLGVSAALLGRDARVLHTGPSDADSLYYHLTQAADFVHTGSVRHLHQVAANDATVYYPLDYELLDAVGMLGPRPDIATMGLNIGFAWLALLACWVIGARWQMAAAAVAAGSSVLAIPLVAAAASGPGMNDIPTIAGLLCAVAIVVHAEATSQRWLTGAALAGLGLGLSAGGKLSDLGFVVLLAVGVVICAPARRLATAGLVAGGAVLTGGFWYVRDWVAVGSPVPNVDLTVAGHGLHGVPYSQGRSSTLSVAHYLTDGSVVRHIFIPELKVVVTPLWPIVLGLPALGILIAVFAPGGRLRRMLGVAAVAGVVVYLMTPGTAMGPPGTPYLFGSNVRYVLPVTAVGLLLLVTARALRRFAVVVTLALTLLTCALLGSSTTAGSVDRAAGSAAALVIAAGVAWAGVAFRRSSSWALTAAVAGLGFLVVANAGAVVQEHYLRDRYVGTTAGDQFFGWANASREQRIGIVGAAEYPFVGPQLNNTLDYVGVSAPHHVFEAPTTCIALRTALAAGRYRYLVVVPRRGLNTDALFDWAAAIPAARLIETTTAGSILRLPPRVTDAGCPGRPLAG